ncbi:MAG: hypothetical protein ACM3N9_04195, partial [Syntrophothermus sp.]
MKRYPNTFLAPLLLLFFTFFSEHLNGQDMLGTTLGNYSGVNGLQLNPSLMHSSKTYLDINILSGDVFLENNYLYMRREDYHFNN